MIRGGGAFDNWQQQVISWTASNLQMLWHYNTAYIIAYTWQMSAYLVPPPSPSLPYVGKKLSPAKCPLINDQCSFCWSFRSYLIEQYPGTWAPLAMFHQIPFKISFWKCLILIHFAPSRACVCVSVSWKRRTTSLFVMWDPHVKMCFTSNKLEKLPKYFVWYILKELQILSELD